MELKQSESNPTVSLIIEIGLMLVIFSSILLRGGVADIYWYPTAMLVVILFCASIFFRGKNCCPLPGPWAWKSFSCSWPASWWFPRRFPRIDG